MNTIVIRLLQLVILLFPFGNILRFTFYPGVHILIFEFALALIALLLLPTYVKKAKEILMFPAVRWGVLFVGIGLFSLFILHFGDYSWPDSIVAAMYPVRLMLYAQLLSFPVLLKLQKEQSKRLLKLFVISQCAFVCISFVQYFIYPDLRNLYYLGWDQHLFRLFGTLFDPNYTGAVIVLNIFLFWYLHNNTKNQYVKIAYLGMLIVSSISLLLTYSRSSFLMMFVSVISYAFLTKKKYVFGLLVLLLCGIFILPRDLGGEGVDLLRTASIYARLSEYEKAADLGASHPAFGVGYNAIQFARAEPVRSGPTVDNSASGVPNSYLFVFATTGIIGLIVYLIYIQQLYKLIRVPELQAAFIGLLGHAFFENTLFYPFIMLWIFMILWIIKSRSSPVSSEESSLF